MESIIYRYNNIRTEFDKMGLIYMSHSLLFNDDGQNRIKACYVRLFRVLVNTHPVKGRNL